MDNGVFPQVVESSAWKDRASNEKKCLFHERLLYRYLTKKIDGWSVEDFLDEQNVENYALYAISDFTTFFLKDLDKNDGKHRPESICDKNVEAFRHRFMGEIVISPDELIRRYQNGKVEKIIIMSVLHENEIIEELLKKGVLLNDIISFVSILYS